MSKSQLISAQIVIFDTLLDNLLLQLTMSFSSSCNVPQAHACVDALSSAIATVLDVESPKPLQQFKEQLPDLENRLIYELFWCGVEYLFWLEDLKTAVSLYRNTELYWHSERENHEKILKLYYGANKLLIDCLKRNFKLTIKLQKEIETALLFPEKKLQENIVQKISSQ
jgi:hypothetical protein